MPTSDPVSTIAKLFGLTERRVQQLARDGVIPKPEKNQYELIGSVRSYIEYLQQRAFGKGAAPQDTHHERARLLKAQADMAEIDLAERTGELVTVERIEADWIQMVTACRAKRFCSWDYWPTTWSFRTAIAASVIQISRFPGARCCRVMRSCASFRSWIQTA